MVEAALFSGWLTPTSLFILLNIVIATILFVSHTSANRSSHGGSDPFPTTLPPQPQPHLSRPSSFLSRVMSFNFSPGHYGPDPEPEHLLSRSVQLDQGRPVTVARSLSFFSRVMSFDSSHHPHDGPNSEPEPRPDLELEPRPVTEPEPHVSRAIQPAPNRPVEVGKAPSLLSRVASFGLQGLNRGVQPLQETGEEGKEAEESKPRESRRPEKKMMKKKQQPVAAPRGGVGGGKATASLRSRDEEVDAKADDFINKFKQQLKMQRLDSLLRYRNST